MRNIVKIIFGIIATLSAVSCGNNTKPLLPNVSGKAGEVIVVVGKDNWEGNLGNEIGSLLARDCEYLPQREPLYSLVNLAPSAFSDMFKLHRNILIFNIDSSVAKQGVIYRTDVWARPQCVIQVNATCADSAIVVLRKNGENIAGAIEQAERNRVIANTLLYEEPKLGEVVSKMIGGGSISLSATISRKSRTISSGSPTRNSTARKGSSSTNTLSLTRLLSRKRTSSPDATPSLRNMSRRQPRVPT